jgi:hypothetical protein
MSVVRDGGNKDTGTSGGSDEEGSKEGGGEGHMGVGDGSSGDGDSRVGKEVEEVQAVGGRKRKNKGGEACILSSGREKHARKGNREVDEWVSVAEGYLRRGVEDERWSKCISLWVQLEGVALNRNLRLTEPGLRPVELARWVSSRKWDSDPVIDDVANYASRWLVWWLAMQPACRKGKDLDWPTPLVDDMRRDMAVLKKAGANGLVVLLVGLKWCVIST